jgi:hypothetical protein
MLSAIDAMCSWMRCIASIDACTDCLPSPVRQQCAGIQNHQPIAGHTFEICCPNTGEGGERWLNAIERNRPHAKNGI